MGPGTLTMGNIHDTMQQVHEIYARFVGAADRAEAEAAQMRLMREEIGYASANLGRERANVRAAYEELGTAIKSETQRRGWWQTFIDRFGTAFFAVMLWALVQYVFERF